LLVDFSGFGSADRAIGPDVNAPLGDSGGFEADALLSDAQDAAPSEGGSDGEAPDTSAIADAADAMESADAGAPQDATEAADADATSDAGEGGPADGAPAGITLVQKAGSHFTVTPTTGASETFSAPTTAGDTVIALCFWTALGYAASVTDSLGNTYLSTAVMSNPQQGALEIFYVPRCAAGADTVTVSMSTGFNGYVGLAIFEYAGLAASNVLEGTAGGYAPAATPSASTPPMATTSSRSLLLAGFADLNGSGVITAGPGWKPLVTNTAFYMLAEAMIVPATPSVAATATMPTTDNQWVALMAAFQGAP
jgi:hypothetical protein